MKNKTNIKQSSKRALAIRLSLYVAGIIISEIIGTWALYQEYGTWNVVMSLVLKVPLVYKVANDVAILLGGAMLVDGLLTLRKADKYRRFANAGEENINKSTDNV